MRRFALLLVLALPASAAAAAPNVLVSIKPIHSIIASVMQGAGEPEVLLRGAASPHSYALSPSDAEKFSAAQLIFWIGPELEKFLAAPIANLGDGARAVALEYADGVKLLPARSGGPWESDADGNASGGTDGHIWLDPENGIAIARAAATVLSEADPANARLYAGNAEAYAARLMLLDARLAERLAAVKGRPYLLFHDAYRYFEASYGLTPAGSVTVASMPPPGARRIAELRERIVNSGAVCIVTTAQFSPRLIATLTEGTQARTASLEDLGANIPSGPRLYQTLLTRIAATFASCLRG